MLLLPDKKIQKSHKICKKAGLNPSLTTPTRILGENSIADLLQKNDLLISIFSNEIRDFKRHLPQQSLIILVNNESIVLETLNNNSRLDKKIKPGTSLSEKDIGTNAVTLANKYQKQVTLPPKKHFCKLFKKYHSYASPLSIKSKKNKSLIALFSKHKLYDKTIKSLYLLSIIISEKYENFRQKEIKYHDIVLSKEKAVILKLSMLGLTNKEIADKIHSCPSNIKKHKSQIFKILKTNNSVETTYRALKHNVISF